MIRICEYFHSIAYLISHLQRVVHSNVRMNMSWAFSVKRYSRSWKRHRRLFTQHINSNIMMTALSNKQISSTHCLLRSLLSDPSRFLEHLMHTTGNIIIGAAYGYDTQPTNDPIFYLAETFQTMVTEGLTPKFLVNASPHCKRCFCPVRFQSRCLTNSTSSPYS